MWSCPGPSIACAAAHISRTRAATGAGVAVSRATPIAIPRSLTIRSSPNPASNDRDSTDKLTIGNMAKYTLATNASRDGGLLLMVKRASKHQPKNVAAVLDEVIDAAETMETTRMRKDALASIEELKRKGPAYKRDVSTWGQVGQGALALGCIVAATTGHVELGLPCVIGGAGSSAALSAWNNQQ